MGSNALGPRKVRQLARVTGLPIVAASVWSHVDSGRSAHLRGSDGRCWWFDRVTSTWERHGNCAAREVAR